MDNNRLYNYISYGNVPKTWRSAYRFDQSIKSLSISMKRALRDAISNGHFITCKKNTADSLVMRCLCSENGKLTEEGKVVALRLVSLKKQCEFLGIEIESLELKKKYADPSVDASFHFIRQGHRCSYCEGIALRKVLSCLYAHRIFEIPGKEDRHTFFLDGLYHYDLVYNLNCGVEGTFHLPFKEYNYNSLTDELLNTINECNRDTFLINYRYLYPKGYCCNGVDESFAVQLYDLIGLDRFGKLARMIYSDPFAFSKGWPDLTLIRDGSVELLEVKTTDKLHESQLITISSVKNNINIKVKVLNVKE